MGLVKNLPQGAGLSGPEIKGKKQVKRFDEIEINQINLMFYGPWKAGKTYSIVDLLEMEMKILYISTDSGGNGLLTVHNELRKRNKMHLKKNLYVVPNLDTYEEVQDFFDTPKSFMPDI